MFRFLLSLSACAVLASEVDILAQRQLRGVPGDSKAPEAPKAEAAEEGPEKPAELSTAEKPELPTAEEPAEEVASAAKPEVATAEEPAEEVASAAKPEVATAEEPSEASEPAEPAKPKVNETKLQEKREKEEGGTCCFSGETKDTCGTCFPMSIASYKSKCSMKNECGHCGGTWCASKCVIGAADPFNKCGTAYPTGITSDPYCLSKEDCKKCNGEWCRAGYNSHFTIVEGNYGREIPEYVPPEDETLGICCYRGKSGTAQDMCGACADVAKDSTCSVKSRCAGCGGTWCPGPRCVKSYADKKNPCNSAQPYTGIATQDEYCALNEKQCSKCKGVWCDVGNITYSDGQKYDPSHPYVSPTDQRLEPEDPAETEAAEEEVANEDSIEDLFPGGLA